MARRLVRVLVPGVLVLGAVGAPAQSDLPARLDALWNTRDRLDVVRAMADECRALVENHPDSYAIQWRCARGLWWAAGDLHPDDKRDRRKVFKEAVACARRAVELHPQRVEGHYWNLVATGQWADLLGFPARAREGMKIPELMREVEEIDPTYHFGGVYRIRAFYNYEMPWPARAFMDVSCEQGVELAQQAVEAAPGHFYNHITLAEGYLRTDQHDKARGELRWVLTTPPDILPESRIDNENDIPKAMKLWKEHFDDPPPGVQKKDTLETQPE